MVYTRIKTYKKAFLDVGDNHKIYYELSGNPKGKPVLFVHGGPGAGFSDKDKRYFNPKVFNIITFDQRGCGKSKPFASIKNNTTFKLASDMNKLLKYLKIKKAILFGGSWGSTLSLAYAIRYPKTVAAMVIRGVMLGTKEEDNYFVYGAKEHFPEAWERMASLVPDNKNIISYYYKTMRSKNKETWRKYALEWARYEFSVSKLIPSELDVKRILKKIKFKAFSLIEMHYMNNHWFLPKDYIIKNVHKIKIPVSIIHGRYDNVCRPLSAYTIHNKIKGSKLYFTLAGHSASDEENLEKLTKEMDHFGKTI